MPEKQNSTITCSRCILDTDVYPSISFDSNGVCDICRAYDKITSSYPTDEIEMQSQLISIVSKIKADGNGKNYDCIAGVSGGVDSTYVVCKAKELGLRTLLVHLDNGWDSELAVSNINNLANETGFDLYTYVINWDEFRDLQVAYLKASVVDIEAITDHAIISTLLKTASRYGIRYILSGENMATEGIIPSSWIHNKSDFMNIRDIHRKYGTLPMKTFPHLTYPRWMYYTVIKKIQNLKILNYMPYSRDDAKKFIVEKTGWRDYGGKHHESLFTKFYQAYILPQKFNIDKRKSHLSTLICSGQLTKQQALEEVSLPLYESRALDEDMNYVLKKLELSKDEFEAIMKLPVRKHTEYRSIMNLYLRLYRIKAKLK